MHKKKKTVALVLLGTAVLSQSAAYGASAASTGSSTVKAAATTVSVLDKLGSIALKGSVSAKLADVGLFAQDSGNILTYTITYYNGSASSVNLADFFSKVTTPGGAVIQGSPVTDSASIKTVAAKSSQSVTYYINAGKTAKVSGVKISLFGWDFSSSDYQRKLGTFTVPASYSPAVAKGLGKKVTLNNLPVTTKAESLEIYKDNGKAYARAAISLSNQGTKVLSDGGYKAYLNSAGGSTFALTADDASAGYQIQPLGKKTLYYLTEIPAGMKTDNMTLQITKEDATLKIELPVVTHLLPAATNADSGVASNTVKTLSISNTTVETQLKSASLYTEDGQAKWTFQFRIKNSGNKSITLPAYELAVRAAEGYSFPLDTKAFASLTLKPFEEKIIDLSADVPLELNQETLKLQLAEPADADKFIFPAAFYKIPYITQTNSIIGTEYGIENSHGNFGVQLKSIQRLPWGDQDQLLAKISIRNMEPTAAQLPAFTGVIKSGITDLSSSAQIVTENTQNILGPYETASVYVLANVPYTYGFSKLMLVLQETSGEDKIPFVSLNVDPLFQAVENIAAGGTFHIDVTGKKAEVTERRTTVYKGTNSNIMYTELVMTSEETRKSDQAQLVAYYKTADNQYYEAKVSQSASYTSPGGKNLITVWSKLPAAVDTSQVVLYVGEGVAEGKLTAQGGTSTGYINTFALSLRNSAAGSQSNLLDVSLFPYTLSITNVTGTIAEGKDTLSTTLSYVLSKNDSFEMGAFEHKLILQYIDPFGQIQEKTLTPGTDLTVGGSKTYSTTFTNSLYKLYTLSGFQLNLYDEFQGERILLATQSTPVTYEK